MVDDEYLTPAQVAEQLQVTTITVRRWIATGELPAAKAGPRKWRIRRADIARMLSPERSSRVTAAAASEDPSFRGYLVVPGER